MPSNYVGDEANTQAPSAKPQPEANITLALPVDGEAKNAASVYQALKAIADFIDFLMHPQAKAALTPQFLRRYLTRVGHTRWALDRVGLPAATVLHWQEFWGRGVTTVNGVTAATAFNGATLNGWTVAITDAGGSVVVTDDVSAPYVELDAGDTVNEFSGLWGPGIPDFGANADMAVEMPVAPLAALDDVELMFGLVRKDTADPRASQGLRLIKTPAAANWQAVATGPSGETVVDTGVPLVTGTYRRLRIEFRGANVNDGGVATAYFFIETSAGAGAVHVATITTNLPATNASRKAVLLAAKNTTGNSGNAQKTQCRAVNFASNFQPAVTA